MNNKPMKILIIEDDIVQCNSFKNYIDKRNDVCLVGITNSSKEAIELVKRHTPEGIILDIELNKGQGSGISFLEKMKEYMVEFKPIIVVTTNSSSEILYNKLHEDGVDLIYYKHQIDYSVQFVISEVISLRKSLYKYNNINNQNKNIMIETVAERENRISDKINSELDLIGISSHLKGRQYIYDAIMYLLEDNKNTSNETVFNYLAKIYKKSSSSISRVMQTVINYAWKTSCPDELEVHYTAKVNYNTGVPSPTELIYYYANKIRKSI